MNGRKGFRNAWAWWPGRSSKPVCGLEGGRGGSIPPHSAVRRRGREMIGAAIDCHKLTYRLIRHPPSVSSLTLSSFRCTFSVLDSFSAYDETIFEGWNRRAALKRHHVPPSLLPHNPQFSRPGNKCRAHPVSVDLAVAVFEHDLISGIELIQMVENPPAPSSPVAHAVACEVDVSLRTRRPRQRGFGHVGYTVL